MNINSPQAGVSPPMTQGGGRSPSLATHSVANIDAQEDNLDDTSTLTATETADAKAIRMLNQYFLSLAATGTVRSIVKERNLIANKLGLIFKKVKFINTDVDVSAGGDIAEVLYKEMRITDHFKFIWWEQMIGGQNG